MATVARFVWGVIRKALWPVLFVLLGGLFALIGVAVFYLDSGGDLEPWHTTFLKEEYTLESGVSDFAGYLALEDRLFAELEREVYGAGTAPDASPYNRFAKGSRTDPTSFEQNWNRTFELSAENAEVGFVLLHGLSDSPYSLSALGDLLHGDGAHVLGLRVPGHGTAPSGLHHTTYDDMAGAVELAVQHVASVVGDEHVYVVGYSNGGALAVHYAAKSIIDEALPVPAGVILMSPEIGVGAAAAYGEVLTSLAKLPGLAHLAWDGTGLEYNPYKYNSFAMRAYTTAFDATQAVQSELANLTDAGEIAQMPPILAFQSAADATVIAQALIDELFDRLASGGHEMVVFDVNRVFASQELMQPALDIDALLTGDERDYQVSVVTNASNSTFDAVVRQRAAGGNEVETRSLGLAWPENVHSLTHIALPFAEDDPLYGRGESAGSESYVRFSDLPVYGERGMLVVPTGALMRQTWNPFYPLVIEKIRAFTAQ